MLACASAAFIASAASATPVITVVNANLNNSPFSFSYQGATFTFSGTSDFFTPVAVQNTAGGAFSSFGGFLGIPVTPTTSFTDRGAVTYGPGDRFASFLSTTTVPSSNGGNFIGLRATSAGGDFFGFAYTLNNVLKSYGFETAANTRITATTAAVPEASTWAMLLIGFGAVGSSMRYRRRTIKIAYS